MSGNQTLYYFKRDRNQQAKIFINMAIACLLYLVGLYSYAYLAAHSLSEQFITVCTSVFTIAIVILLLVAIWYRKHPACYEAMITNERFIVRYPHSSMWSFDVSINEIKCFEHRNTLSHAGSGIAQSGVVLDDGRFVEISMNYGANINKMYQAVKTIKPSVTFSKTVNVTVQHISEGSDN